MGLLARTLVLVVAAQRVPAQAGGDESQSDQGLPPPDEDQLDDGGEQPERRPQRAGRQLYAGEVVRDGIVGLAFIGS